VKTFTVEKINPCSLRFPFSLLLPASLAFFCLSFLVFSSSSRSAAEASI
jgi:hypothetical protein